MNTRHRATPEGVSLHRVAIPSEHGGWSLTLEPALLGLIVAPSASGVALAGAALMAFLLRTPFKLAALDTLRRRRLRRTEVAAIVAAGYAVVLGGLLAVAGSWGDPGLWQPLLIASPLFVAALAYDVRARSRRLLPEIAGSVGIGSVVAAIVLADGGSRSLAYGLWAIVAARVTATIPLVRHQIRRAKRQRTRVGWSDAAQVVAVAVAGFGVAVTDVPVAALYAVVALAGFGIVSARMPVPSVAMIGAQQVVLGLSLVLVTGLASIAP